jgi:hypothetical protein
MSRGFMIGAGAHTCVRPGGSPPSPASSSSSPCSPSTWWARGRPAPASRPSRRPRRSPRLGPRPRVPGGLDTRTRRMLSRQRCRNRCRTCPTATSASPISRPGRGVGAKLSTSRPASPWMVALALAPMPPRLHFTVLRIHLEGAGAGRDPRKRCDARRDADEAECGRASCRDPRADGEGVSD